MALIWAPHSRCRHCRAAIWGGDQTSIKGLCVNIYIHTKCPVLSLSLLTPQKKICLASFRVCSTGQYGHFTLEQSKQPCEYTVCSTGQFGHFTLEQSKQPCEYTVCSTGQYGHFTLEQSKQPCEYTVCSTGQYGHFTLEQSKQPCEYTVCSTGQFGHFTLEQSKQPCEYTVCSTGQQGHFTLVCAMYTPPWVQCSYLRNIQTETTDKNKQSMLRPTPSGKSIGETHLMLSWARSGSVYPGDVINNR